MKVGRGKAWCEKHKERIRIRAKIDGAIKTIASYPQADEATAIRHRDVWNTELAKGTISVDPKQTLGAYGAAWIESRAINGSEIRDRIKSIATERYTWSRHIAGSDLAKRHLKSIDRRAVVAFTVELRARKAVSAIVTKDASGQKKVELRTSDRTISKSHQKHVLRLLRGALQQAVRDGLIKSNPAADVVVAKGGRPPKDKSEDWLRAHEIRALLTCTKISLRDRTAYATAIALALRLGDIKALRVDQIFLDDPEPHVRVVISKPDDKLHKIPIPEWFGEPWLRPYLASLPEGARYLFPGRRGGRYGRYYAFNWASKKSSVRARKPSALEVAGVARQIGFHDLRGTTATSLATGIWGRVWSLHEIQAMLAHSDSRVTERYVRRAQSTLFAAMRATTGGPSGPNGVIAAVESGSPPVPPN